MTSEVKEMHQYGKPHVPDVIDIADNLCLCVSDGVNALFKRSKVVLLSMHLFPFPSQEK